MRILFIAHEYLGLYKVIEKELVSQNHKVVTILDPNYCTYAWTRQPVPLRIRIKRYIVHKTNAFKHYWSKRCKYDERLNQPYDLLFVIQGLSFSPYLLEHLKKINPKLKSSLYIWDSNRLFDFFHNVPYFDKVYSFDWYDVQHDFQNKVKFLPFFWPKEVESFDGEDIIYDISCIGSNHDGRLHIFKSLYSQFQDQGVKSKLNLYIPKNIKFTLKNRLKLLLFSIKCNKNEEYEDFLLSVGLIDYPFVIHNLYTPAEVNKIISQSKSILDTDRELQFGTTPRLIWALAANKHIYTTNEKIVNLPFYNSSYIHIIERNHPVIDFDLIENNTNISPRDSIEYLRIDNWIKNFL